MGLTGIPFLLLVVVLTVGAFVAGAALPAPTGRSMRGFATRLLRQLGTSALTLILVAVVLNNENGWYANWADLFGSSSVSMQHDKGGASAAKALQARPAGPGLEAAAPGALPPLPSPGQRVQTFRFTGAHSGLTGRVVVSLPHGYEDPANASRAYPVIEAFHGFPGTPEVWMQGVNLVPSIDTLSAQHVMSDAIVVAPQIEFPTPHRHGVCQRQQRSAAGRDVAGVGRPREAGLAAASQPGPSFLGDDRLLVRRVVRRDGSHVASGRLRSRDRSRRVRISGLRQDLRTVYSEQPCRQAL